MYCKTLYKEVFFSIKSHSIYVLQQFLQTCLFIWLGRGHVLNTHTQGPQSLGHRVNTHQLPKQLRRSQETQYLPDDCQSDRLHTQTGPLFPIPQKNNFLMYLCYSVTELWGLKKPNLKNFCCILIPPSSSTLQPPAALILGSKVPSGS